eukprot:TRINITY_DN4998_c0_g1_i1.p1 TRINITY_DN4998_c0_g1~~TRINITY_DN4998_c0_g1_i1.p1  ORF type:complete len:337 (+),score=54.27 TRINITY_DN4998_c0_g1_i1:140-1150(+)
MTFEKVINNEGENDPKSHPNSPVPLKINPNKISPYSVSIISCVCYATCSVLMTLTTKSLLSSYKFNFPITILVYQHLFTLLLLNVFRRWGLIQFEEMSWNRAQKWLPVNILFASMILSGSYTLKFLSVPMVTVFKNLTTVIITLGDNFLFGQPLSAGILSSIFLMFLGSFVASINDLEFTMVGYFWMAINCLLSAAYVLYMRHAMKGTKLSEFGMVYYNNSLSLPFLLPLLLYTENSIITDMKEYPYLYNFGFIALALFSGLNSFGISLTSLWTVKTTSPTTYSIVGALNKIPLAILGILIFHTKLKIMGYISVFIGFWGGVFYFWVKKLGQKKKL